MSNSKRNKSEMAPSFQKNRKVQDTKSELLKPGDKAQPTPEQIRIAQIIDTTKHDDPGLKDKVKQVMDATQKSEEEVLAALHDCDFELNAAVNIIIEGGSQDKWSTSTKKKKNKPPIEKRDSSGNAEKGASNPAGDTEDWNESDNADESSAPKTFPKGKGPPNRNNRPPSRPWNKRGGAPRANGKENFSRNPDGNQEYQKGGKPYQGRNTFRNSRNSTQKDGEPGDRDISDRLGQGEKQDSGSDWGSDASDKNVGADDAKQNDSHSKPVDNKWQSEDSWKNSRGRGGSRPPRGGGYNSYPRNNEDGDTRPYYNKQGGPSGGRGRGGGRYQRGTGRGGRMSNGPSRSWGRGAPRGRGRGGSRPSIDTWNPAPKDDHETEDWDQEEDYTGSLADTKVFTPSEPKTNPEPVKEPEPEISSQIISQSSEVVSSNQLSTSASQFLSQLTNASSKPLPTSVFNDVPYNKTEMPTSDYSTGFSINSYVDTESPSLPLDDMSRVKPLRPRLPPPSKIPSSAVEMPPDVGSSITLDVQFGALELGDMMGETVSSNVQEVPSPPPEPAQPPASEPSNLLLNDNQNYSSVRSSVPNAMSQLPELLSSKSETSTSNYYQDSIYQSNQYPKSTHQSYNSNYTTQVGSTYGAPSIYGSAGLGTTSLTNPYPQTYSGGNLQRPSALTSTTNSKEYDVPTPSVNISSLNPSSTTVTPSSILSSSQGNVSSKSSSTMGKLITVPPGVAAAPMVNTPYIMNQTPAGMPAYFQQPVYTLEDLQMFQQQRMAPSHVANFYEMASFPNTGAGREGVQYNLSDTRFAQGDTNTSPVQATSLGSQTAGSQNQPMMNPAMPPYAIYYGTPGVIPTNYQYSTPTALYPLAQPSSSSSSPYAKAPANYSASYSGQYEGGQSGPAPDFKATSSKVQGYPTATSASTLSNLYSKSYEKHSFCQTPPPYANSGGSLGGGYGQTQQLFYSTMTPHGMPAVDTQGQRSQLAAAQQTAKMPSKPNAVRQYPNPGPAYWHQQN